MSMTIAIRPLSTATFDTALQLRDKVFPGLNKMEYTTLKASLDDKDTRTRQSLGIKMLEYWTATDKNNDLAGLVGLYEEIGDEDDVIWLGWFCVDPERRGEGIGRVLLDFAIEMAKNYGKKTLKIYTTSEDQHISARILYTKRGFIDISKSWTSFTRLYALTF